MTKEEAVIEINKLRRANKNKWYSASLDVDGSTLHIKAYDLWVQRLEYKAVLDGFNCTTVKDFKASLLDMMVSAYA